MRISSLRRTANNQLTHDNRGSHRDKQYRHFVIHKVIYDLFALKQSPATWYGLKQSHIQQLVSHWKKKKVKPATMMKYMTVIRYFLISINHSINGIDNQTLEIIRPKRKTKKAKGQTPAQLNHPIAQVIFEMQTGFGLTFSEATRLISTLHVREDSIWITRDMSFNHQDRIIPIRHEMQQRVLQSLHELTGDNHSLISAHGYHPVLYIYRVSMQRADLPAKHAYRHLYAKDQLRYLMVHFSRENCCAILLREMGLKSRSTLWKYLHEPD